MPQKTKGLTSHQTLYHFCALFVRTEYHHQNYPLAVRLPVCLPEWHVVQLARLVLGLSSLAVLPALAPSEGLIFYHLIIKRLSNQPHNISQIIKII